MNTKITNNLKNPRGLAIKVLQWISPLIKSNKTYLKMRFRLFMGVWPNLDNPSTFNEKLNWMKLYYHLPIFTKLVDKYEVKPIVSKLIGEEHVIHTLGVWDRVDEIDFDSLPDKFVLKCTHDSGGLIVCKDKLKLDVQAAKQKLHRALKTNYYNISREWGYKYVKPRIIAEEYMEDCVTHSLDDYKFFCFNGKAKVMFVGTDRSTDVKFDFFDQYGKHLDILNGHPQAKVAPILPPTFSKMVELAELLSTGYPYMRVDLYDVDGRIYFGEYTLYHFGGTMPFSPAIWDEKMGDWIELPPKTV